MKRRTTSTGAFFKPPSAATTCGYAPPNTQHWRKANCPKVYCVELPVFISSITPAASRRCGVLRKGQLRATVHLRTANNDRGYEAQLFGRIETKNGKVTRLDLVAKGTFWGEGRYTRNAPKGRFPLAVAFTLADGKDAADSIPPQASRGWVQGYLK